MKIERYDLIKVLECCIDSSVSKCNRCPYREKMRCKENAMQDALSMIHELTEENEMLTDMLHATISGQETMQRAWFQQKSGNC